MDIGQAFPVIVTSKNIGKYKSFKEETIAKDAFNNVTGTLNDDLKKYYVDGRFNSDKFTKDFRSKQDADKLLAHIKEGEKLDALDKKEIKPGKKLHELTIYSHLIAFKNTFFGIIYDLALFNSPVQTFTKEDRLFYIGLMLVIVVIIYALLTMINKD